MKEPLVTICVPTHNSGKFLEKTLKSILGQSYPNFEILVSDNASADETEKITRSFKDPKISFRKNIQNPELNTECVGAYGNYEGCIKSGLIKGELIGFYHSDDIYDKDIIKEEAEFLLKNPKAAAVFCLGDIIDEKDNKIGETKLPKELRGKDIYNFKDIFESVLNNGNVFLLTPTLMIRKNIFEQVGLFREKEFRTSADLEMWLRISEKYSIGILKKKLISRRVGGAGTKYQYLCTDRADFFKVMDYYLENKKMAEITGAKPLGQYKYQEKFNDILRAMNFLIKGENEKAKSLVNQGFSLKILTAFFENIDARRTKIMILWVLLFLGINTGLGRPLGKLLYKLRYG